MWAQLKLRLGNWIKKFEAVIGFCDSDKWHCEQLGFCDSDKWHCAQLGFSDSDKWHCEQLGRKHEKQ